VLLRSACTSGNHTATLSLLVLADMVSGVAAAADAMAAGVLPAGCPTAAADGAPVASSSGRPGAQQQHHHQQQQLDQWQEQWLKVRRQQLAAALQVVKPSPATDAVIVKLAGRSGATHCYSLSLPVSLHC